VNAFPSGTTVNRAFRFLILACAEQMARRSESTRQRQESVDTPSDMSASCLVDLADDRRSSSFPTSSRSGKGTRTKSFSLVPSPEQLLLDLAL
jgi:hypothetical protein